MAYATMTDLQQYVSGMSSNHALLEGAAVLLEQASDEVDALCYGRIRKIGLEKLTDFQQKKVKKAVCYHAAFLAEYGDLVASPLTSYRINGVSMSFSADRIVTQGGVTTSNVVMMQLRQSGLASRLIP